MSVNQLGSESTRMLHGSGDGRQVGCAGGGPPPGRAAEPFWRRHLPAVLTALTLLALLTGSVSQHLGAPALLWLTSYMLSYLAGGVPSALTGLQSLWQRRIDVDLLMVLAAVGAAILGYWSEGATLLFLFSLSNALQSYAMDRTRRAIEALMDLRPDVALLRDDAGERWVPVEELQPGDRVVVRPGDRVPIDGTVLQGVSAIDQAAITGESVPAEKQPGDEVFAGTINTTGLLLVEATRRSDETMLAKIIRRVEESRQDVSPTQRLVDRVEQVYATVVLGLTAAVAALPILVGSDPERAGYRALVFMVVASPCAVAIAAPAAILSAIANAARHGVLFNGGRHLENTGKVRVVALDKTGTLTQGRPQLTDLVPASGVTEEELLATAASLEFHSQHPLGIAVVQAATQRNLELQQAENVQAVTGSGIEATLGGELAWVGSQRMVWRMEAVAGPLADKAAALEAQGKTVAYVGQGQRVLGAIALQDTLRPQAVATVAALRRMGIQHIVMLTGDNARVAQAIGRQVGADQVYAELLPDEKVEQVRSLAAVHGPVAMVGDGVNDAPALATAFVGIAMGAAGSDAALETADVVLVSDELERIPYAIGLSRRTNRLVWQNLSLAIGVIGVMALITLADLVPLSVGVLAHEGSTVLVMLSGLRMLAYRGERVLPEVMPAAAPGEQLVRKSSAGARSRPMQ